MSTLSPSRKGVCHPIKNSIIYKTGIVKRYEDLSAMQNDKTANEESLNTFSSTYWTVVNGVPTWNSAKKSAN